MAEEMRSDLRALRDCLEASGVVSEERFSAAQHRQKFLRLLRRCSGWDAMTGASLEDLSPGPLTSIALFLGQGPGLPFRVVSSAIEEHCRRARSMSSCRCFVWGGFSGERNVETGEVLDLSTGEWSAVPPMMERRSGGACAAIGHRVYVAGGFDGVKNKSSAQCFDLEQYEWEQLPNMSTNRFACTGAEYGGYFCVVGGNSGLQRLESVECYVRERSRWEQLPPMRVPRIGAVAGTLNGRIYVCGGQDLSSVECFDQGQWGKVPSMRQKRFGSAGVVCGGFIYVAGGKGKSKPNLTSVERYSPQVGQWEEVEPMITRRFACTATSVQGKIYVFGGLDIGSLSFGGTRLAEGECFDPTTGKWELLPPMGEGRSGSFVAGVVQDSVLF